MGNSAKKLTPSEQSNLSTYLGFARDDAVIASHCAHRGDASAAEFRNDEMLRNLQIIAKILGLELVARHVRIPDTDGGPDTILALQPDGTFKSEETDDLEKYFPNGLVMGR